MGNDGHDIFCKMLAIHGHVCITSVVHYDLYATKTTLCPYQIDWIGNDFKYQILSLSLREGQTHTHTYQQTCYMQGWVQIEIMILQLLE